MLFTRRNDFSIRRLASEFWPIVGAPVHLYAKCQKCQLVRAEFAPFALFMAHVLRGVKSVIRADKYV